MNETLTLARRAEKQEPEEVQQQFSTEDLTLAWESLKDQRQKAEDAKFFERIHPVATGIDSNGKTIYENQPRHVKKEVKQIGLPDNKLPVHQGVAEAESRMNQVLDQLIATGLGEHYVEPEPTALENTAKEPDTPTVREIYVKTSSDYRGFTS